MQWAATDFGVHLLASECATPELYLWQDWQTLYPVVDRLVCLSPNKGAIRTSQSFKGKSGWLGFGRMIWSRKSNELWTQKYRSPEHEDKELEFYDTEIWAPDWNTVWRERRAPDVLVKLEASERSSIRQALLIAIREPIHSERKSEIRTLVAELQTLLPEVRHYVGQRPWAEQVYGSGGYSNGLNDCGATVLAKQLSNGGS